MSEEHKRKISQSLTGKKMPDEVKAKISKTLSGRAMPIETRIKLSEIHKKNGYKPVTCGQRIPHSESTKKKLSQLRSGDKNPMWNGGIRIDRKGYRLKYSPNHPRRSKCNKLVPEHRLVVEQHIGRFLTKDETVHHINHVKDDNRIENLMLFKDGASHTKFHAGITVEGGILFDGRKIKKTT